VGAPFRAIFSTVSASNQLQFIWRGLINAVPSVVNRTDACPLSREKQRWRLGTDDVALWHKADVLKASPDVRFRGDNADIAKSMSVPDL
jgi:hypothetical protein